MLELLLLSTLVGFSSFQVAKALDFSMQYGHLLFSFRRWMAYKMTAKQNKMTFKRAVVLIEKMDEFADVSREYDALFETVARYENKYVLFLCRTCLGFHLNNFLWIGLFLLGVNPVIAPLSIVAYIAFAIR